MTQYRNQEINVSFNPEPRMIVLQERGEYSQDGESWVEYRNYAIFKTLRDAGLVIKAKDVPALANALPAINEFALHGTISNPPDTITQGQFKGWPTLEVNGVWISGKTSMGKKKWAMIAAVLPFIVQAESN